MHSVAEGAEQTRLQEIGQVWGMPELGDELYLFEAFNEIGRTHSTGFGQDALPWSEIMVYAQSTEALNEPWEFRAIRQMSEVYITELFRGKQPLTIAPVDREPTDDVSV